MLEGREGKGERSEILGKGAGCVKVRECILRLEKAGKNHECGFGTERRRSVFAEEQYERGGRTERCGGAEWRCRVEVLVEERTTGSNTQKRFWCERA